MLLGILFLFMGLLSMLSRKYTMIKIKDSRYIVKRKLDAKDGLHRYKTLLGIFSIILGAFCIANHIIY